MLTWNSVGWSLRAGGLEWLGQRLGVLVAVRAARARAVSSRGGAGRGSVSVVGSSRVRIRARGRRSRRASTRSGTQSVPASTDAVRGGVRTGSGFGQLPGARGQSGSAPGRRPEGASSREGTEKRAHAQPATPGGRRKEQRYTDPSSSDTSRAHRTQSSGRGVEQGGDGPETAERPKPGGRVPLIRRLAHHGPILTEVADNVKFRPATRVVADRGSRWTYVGLPPGCGSPGVPYAGGHSDAPCNANSGLMRGPCGADAAPLQADPFHRVEGRQRRPRSGLKGGCSRG